MSTVQQRNAAAIVKSWRDDPDLRANAWGPQADGKPPSELMGAVAAEWGRLVAAIDGATDRLSHAGFLRSHGEVIAFNEMASEANRRFLKMLGWTEHLIEAEAEAANEDTGVRP